MQEHQEAEVVTEEGALDVITTSALEVMTKVEIDQAVATAKAYPRSVTTFKRRAIELATLDKETAASCFYTLRKGGSKIEGESVRLAEIVSATWGNIRVAGRILREEATYVVAQGICADVENNYSASVEVSRPIVNRSGERYKQDMVNTTKQAAIAIATRNAVLKVVPKALVRPVYLAARKASVGDMETMGQRREEIFAWFKKRGASKKQVLAAVGCKGPDDVGFDEIIDLNGFITAITNGQTTVEEVLNPGSPETGRSDIADAEGPKESGPAAEDVSALASQVIEKDRSKQGAVANIVGGPVSDAEKIAELKKLMEG